MYLTRAVDIIDHSILRVVEHTGLDDLIALLRRLTPSCNVIAMVTDRGQLRGLLDYPLKTTRGRGQSLKPYVSHPMRTFGPNEPSGNIARLMLTQGHERVAVMDGTTFLGLITRDSVVSAYGELRSS